MRDLVHPHVNDLTPRIGSGQHFITLVRRAADRRTAWAAAILARWLFGLTLNLVRRGRMSGAEAKVLIRAANALNRTALKRLGQD